MRMILRQVSGLMEGGVVSEREYEDAAPGDIVGVLQLILDNCTDFMRSQDIPITQGDVTLKQLTLRYPGFAGVIEVHFRKPEEKHVLSAFYPIPTSYRRICGTNGGLI